MAIWAQIDTNIFANPKISGLNKDCKLAYVASILAAREVEKEGIFSLQIVTGMTGFVKKNTQLLVEAGLWEPTEFKGCYRVHDYRENGLSAQDKARLAEVSRRNGAKGGRPKKTPDPRNPEENPAGLLEKTQGETQPINPEVTQSRTQGETQKNPLNRAEQSNYPPGFINETTPPRGGASASAGDNTRAKRKTTKPSKSSKPCALPDDWKPTEAHRERMAQMGIAEEDAVRVFRDWAANGAKAKSWNGTFTTALMRWIPKVLADEIDAQTRLQNARWQSENSKRPLPSDWLPNTQGENLALNAGITDISAALQVFKDWHSRKKTLSGDWDAEWRAALRWLPDATKTASGQGKQEQLDTIFAGLEQAQQTLDANNTPTDGQQHPEIVTKTALRDANTPSLDNPYPENKNSRENPPSVNRSGGSKPIPPAPWEN